MANSLGLGLRANLSRVLNAFSPAAVAAKQPVVATVKSSAVAKERLAIILAHQRTAGSLQDMLSGVDINTLQAELLACVKRHVRDSADQSQIQISVRQDGDMEIFEMSVPLGEQ